MVEVKLSGQKKKMLTNKSKFMLKWVSLFSFHIIERSVSFENGASFKLRDIRWTISMNQFKIFGFNGQGTICEMWIIIY